MLKLLQNLFYRFLRQHWGTQALLRLENLEESDIFINFDADEIPSKKVLL